MSGRRREKGFTLLEMVIVIVVAGLAIPAMMTGFATIANRSISSEAIADAGFYSSQMLDEITSKEYIDPADADNFALGPNGSETYPDFNDVDDYNGFERTAGMYSLSVTVSYAVLDGGTWKVSADRTAYKMISVSVKNTRNGLSSMMTTIVSE